MWQRRWGKKLKAEGYIQRILPIHDKFFRKNPEKMLIEDNAKPHTADNCEKASNSRLWTRIKYPQNSPDLNSIENICRRVKQIIYRSQNSWPKKISEL
jgi:hypothetical protein